MERSAGDTEASGYPAEAWLDLHTNGFASAFNTINALSGEFTLTVDGLQLARWTTTLLPQSAETNEQQVVLDAFDDFAATARAGVPVDVVDTQLVFQLPESRMIFRGAGRIVDPVLPPPPTRRLRPDGSTEPILTSG